MTVKVKDRKKASSRWWLGRQLNDPYVERARLEGYRSRAAYKLLEIHKRYQLFQPRVEIVDLGSTPGSWSQAARQITHGTSKIIAVDLLDMEEIEGVTFIKKDFRDSDTAALIKSYLTKGAHLVMSDMAANTTGHGATDHLRTMVLCEIALDFAMEVLLPGGHFIAKIFRGGTEGELLARLKQNFTSVKHFKPTASRRESTELYLVAMQRK